MNRSPRSPGRFPAARLVAAAAALLIAAAAGADEPPAPIGVAPGSRAEFARVEARTLAVPSPQKARAWLRTLTEEPHVAGTPADRKTAEFVRDRLREWGWQADLVEYRVLLNYPLGTPSLRITRPETRDLKVVEDPWPADKDSASLAAFPAFHGYGPSGAADGQVVYANYGRPEDFAALEELGISVKDTIVLVRYGGPFRGLKVLNAQKRGARGVLIFSDPADDGYAKGDVYPNGPYRPPSAIQRGSVQFLSLGPGDPTTPGRASAEGAERLPFDRFNGFPIALPGPVPREMLEKSRDEVAAWEKQTGHKRDEYFAAIPSLPISYEAARPILEALGGPNAPDGAQGGLPLPYHVGPGPVEVRFSIQMDYQIRPIWNVIATLKGSVEPDRWVLISNHRDAWTYGAVDPGSGTAATLEACRALGEAVKAGWSPRRTLVYASWDAEEYGLVGSTEWAEDHAEELDRKAVMMLNVDSAVSGRTLDLDGIPSMRDLLLDAAGAITDPRSGKTLRRAWTDARRSAWARSAPIDLDEALWEDGSMMPTDAAGAFSPRMNPLGSGSDYTAFVDHLGIPAVDVNFQGRYGVYHSIYDDFYWMENFCDPEFLTHATAARLYAAIALRAAGAEVVPLTFTPYAEALRDHVDDLRRMVVRKARSASPGKTVLEFDGLPDLVRAVRRFADRAGALDRATADLAARDGIPAAALARVNDALMRIERAFLDPDGLPGRPWFQHLAYAPGLTTGYASWPLPGVYQAIHEDDAGMLRDQVRALVDRLDAVSRAMAEATEAAGDAVK